MRRLGMVIRATTPRSCSAATTVTGIQNIQYSSQFGNGVSATLGLEDSGPFERVNILNLANGVSAVGINGVGGYGGDHVPDIAGNFSIDQAWGLWQLPPTVPLITRSLDVARPSANAA
jgi:hypothetical protein